MKRWLVRICVFLTLGAIVNVAVAWGCSAPVVLNLTDDPCRTVTREQINQRYREYAPANIFVSEEHWVGAAEYRALGFERDIVTQWGPLVLRISGYRAGWPTRSVHGNAWTWSSRATGMGGDSNGLILPADSIVPSRNPLPWLPIWPGFAINTVFYAGVLWLLFAAPLALRRRRRIKRGLCPKCAYDLRGSDSATCPECGAAVRLQRIN